MYFKIFSTITPILFCTAIGYVWARLKRPFDTDFITTLIFYIGSPCLILANLSAVELDLSILSTIATACVLITAGLGIINALILKALRIDLKTYLPSLMFGNHGNMGLPLCLYAFGEQGLAMALVYFVSLAILHFTVGISIIQGFSVKRLILLLINPVVISALVAAAMLAMRTRMPIWLYNPVKLLGDITIPLMLLALGVSLARLRISSLSRSVAMGVLKIGVGFLLALLVVRLFALGGTLRGVLLIQASMPVAVFNYLFALKYEKSPEEVAGIVVFSTLLSFMVLPLLLSFVF